MNIAASKRVSLNDPSAAQKALVRDTPSLGAVVDGIDGKTVEISRGSVLRFRVIGGWLSHIRAFPVTAKVSFDEAGADVTVVPNPGRAVATLLSIEKKYQAACDDFAVTLEGALALHSE